MSLVGIIANPASGKDIRRVVARGSVVGDHDKINLLRRMLAALQALQVPTIRWMPDVAALVDRAATGLGLRDARALDLPVRDTPDDTTAAAAALRERGAACIIVLGGDGTCRAAAKGAGTTPLLPVSTGTNNAFPLLVEATLAGLAAAVVAHGAGAAAIGTQPWLRVLREGEPIDLALIDIASFNGLPGARAVWQLERVRQIVTTRHTPGTIGLSAVAGYLGLTPPAPECGLALTLGEGGTHVLAPIAPGVIERVGVCAQRWLQDGEELRVDAPCVLALDGERDLPVRNGMLIAIRYERQGPRVVDVQRALELGVQHGLFDPQRLAQLTANPERLRGV